MTTMDTSEALAARAVGGDAAALTELCRRLQGPIFRLCVRMLGHVGDAEDATQDVLVQIVTHLGQFAHESALSTWAHRVAVRHALALRARRRDLPALDEATFAAMLERGLAYGRENPSPGPEDEAFVTEVRLACTQGMLMMLSPDERLALVLVELLGFDTLEAAAIAEVRPDALRQRLARGRARLVTFVEAHCGLARDDAACRCEAQVPAKLRRPDAPEPTFAPRAGADLPMPRVDAAREELAAVRTLAAVYRRQGALEPSPALHARVRASLPILLAD